jgi:hypothetical protein
MVHGAHLFFLSIHAQTGLQLVAMGRNGANFSWRGEAFHGPGVQDVTEFDSG